MNTWVEAPPRRKGLGCFARGCLILLIFAIVLAIACFAGMSWGLHRHSALFYGSYWLAKTRSIAEAPMPVPEFTGSDQRIQTVRERWQDFEQKARAGQPTEIELSADDINGLIATSEDMHGKSWHRLRAINFGSRPVCRSEDFSAGPVITLTVMSLSN
jgi:hypothetical protein